MSDDDLAVDGLTVTSSVQVVEAAISNEKNLEGAARAAGDLQEAEAHQAKVTRLQALLARINELEHEMRLKRSRERELRIANQPQRTMELGF